jgi:hypothetical protein
MTDKIKNISTSGETVHSEGGRSGQKEKNGKADREIKEKSQEFIEGVSEVVEGVESVETTGEVAEELGEGKKKAPSAGGKGGTQGVQNLLEQISPPSIDIMRIQVATQIKNEIRILEKEVVRLMRSNASFHPFKLNKVVSKIRELKDILSGLAYATAETIKGWWMKFVRGINT